MLYEHPNCAIKGVSVRNCTQNVVRDYMINVLKNKIITITPEHKYGDGQYTYTGNLLDMLVLCISKLQIRINLEDEPLSGFDLSTRLCANNGKGIYVNNLLVDSPDLRGKDTVDDILNDLDGICWCPQDFYIVSVSRYGASILYMSETYSDEPTNITAAPYTTTDTGIYAKAGITGKNLWIQPTQGFAGINIFNLEVSE